MPEPGADGGALRAEPGPAGQTDGGAVKQVRWRQRSKLRRQHHPASLPPLHYGQEVQGHHLGRLREDGKPAEPAVRQYGRGLQPPAAGYGAEGRGRGGRRSAAALSS